MRIFGRLKKQARRGRLGKFLSVNLRWGMRRMRRFFTREQFVRGITGSYARRLYTMLLLLLAVGGLAVASSRLADSFLADEAVLVRRLSDPDYDRANPILAALDNFGSSNRIQVTVETERVDNLHPQKVDLDRGNVNLVLTLNNGNIMEYTLQNKRMDNFESGNTDQFTLILPSSISVFDITEYKMVLLPDAKGVYGNWRCARAQVSFLLGGKRTLLAEGAWQSVWEFSEQYNETVLPIATEQNAEFARMKELFPYALAVCEQERETVHDPAIKRDALISLGLLTGDTLYLDVETVGLENQNEILQNQLGNVQLSELDGLGYNGTMLLRVRFIDDFEGSYYKDYPLDTPGKDDFELGTGSTFALQMPKGATAFDIASMELLVEDATDAWAPRMVRAYLKTDYNTVLELARLSDRQLAAERKTCIFYRGLIDTSISPLALDLTQSYGLPKNLKETMESKYFTEISGVMYSMYFGEHSYYERQKLYYSQLHALFGGVATDEETN